MKLSEIKKFLLELPDNFTDFVLVNGELGFVPNEEDSEEGEYYYRVDKPIVSIHVDEASKEICFLHQSKEEVDKILSDADSDNEVEADDKG